MLRADVFVWNHCPDHCLHFLHFVSDRECLDCVFAAARIASLVHLNLVSVEHRRPPRSVPQPFTLKSVRSHLGLKEPERLKHIGSAGSGCSCCKLVAHSVKENCAALASERRSLLHCSSQSGGAVAPQSEAEKESARFCIYSVVAPSDQIEWRLQCEEK